MRPVKFALPLILVLVAATTACNTIENRRSLYAPKKADGPYTRSLREGTWDDQKTVDEQYAESKKLKKQPQIKVSSTPAPGKPTP
jgi:hypothetical protein